MDPIIGQIQLFGFNFAPRGWALCQGQLLAIAQNQALFSLLGTIYGGDGRTTFALPDLRGRAALGFGAGPGLSTITQGSRGGATDITLTVAHLPQHNHQLLVSSANATQNTATAGAAIATPGKIDGRAFASTAGFATDTPNVVLSGASINNNGGQQSFFKRDPYLGLNYSIALVGVYPSRN